MFVSVIYQNKKMGVVDDGRLDELISSNKIKKFLRSEGWVTIGVDAIRRDGRSSGKGPERRRYGPKAD